MTNEIEPSRIPPAPIHPLAALATITLDNIFGVVEILDPLALLGTSLLVGVTGAVTSTLIQRYIAKDEWGPSVAKGLVMGVLAGVPFQVVGTVVGIPLLVWAGLHEWKGFPLKRQQKQIPPDEGMIVTEANPEKK